MTSSTFLYSIVQSMAESRARLGTNSFGRVKGPNGLGVWTSRLTGQGLEHCV